MALQRTRTSTRCTTALAAGSILLSTACTRTERADTSAQSAPQPSAAATAPANAGAPANGRDAVGTRTMRGQMLSHYADTATMRTALVAGDLVAYKAAAAAVARDEWAPSAAPKESALARQARAAATVAGDAPSLIAAAQQLGVLGGACAACHLATSAPEIRIAPDEPGGATDPRMLAHAVASDRLWAGLTLPSDDSWASGIQLLLQDPAFDTSPEVSAAALQLRNLARRGKQADQDERGEIFADVLSTCSNCHERLGVVLENGAVAH